MIEFIKCGLYFNIVSSTVHTLLPSVLQRLDSRGIISSHPDHRNVPNCRYDPIIGRIPFSNHCVFSCWGQKIDGAKIFMDGDQSIQHRFEMSLVLIFQVLNYVSSVGFSGKKTNAFSIRKGWI